MHNTVLNFSTCYVTDTRGLLNHPVDVLQEISVSMFIKLIRAEWQGATSRAQVHGGQTGTTKLTEGNTLHEARVQINLNVIKSLRFDTVFIRHVS